MRCKPPIFPLLSPILAAALVAAPTHVALAAAPAETAEPAPEPAAPESDEAKPGTEEAPAETPEQDEPAEAPAEEAPPTAAPDARTGAAPAEQPEPEPEPEPEPPPPVVDSPVDDGRPEEPRVGGKPRTGKGLMIAGGAVLGAGLASTITFAAITRGCSIDGPLECKYRNQDQFLIPMGVAASLLGAVLLSVGVGYHVSYKRWERWTPGQDQKKGKKRRASAVVAPTMVRGGAGMAATGRF
jgi:hypothetical protein